MPAGDAPQVTSPPFTTPPLQQQPTSGDLLDPASPSPTPSATPEAPRTAFGKFFGTPQHTPAGPPQASIFSFATSPATVPVKGRHEGSSVDGHLAIGSPVPAMFSAATGRTAADNTDVEGSGHGTPAGSQAAAAPAWGSHPPKVLACTSLS